MGTAARGIVGGDATMTVRVHDWTHPICYPCWFRARGAVEPHRMVGSPLEPCCQCGRTTAAGIFVRARPGSRHIPRCSDAQIDRTIFVQTGE